MNNETPNNEATNNQLTGPDESSLLDFQQRCPDCAVGVGEAHTGDHDSGCDVARCLGTGRQRLSCEIEHDCGRDLWSGWWPGDLDCERLGWMIGPGLPDLNRLYAAAVWNPARCAWVLPS